MLCHFHNEVMAVSIQFKSKDSYEIKCGGSFTFQMTRHFLPSLNNLISKGFFFIFNAAVLLLGNDENTKF